MSAPPDYADHHMEDEREQQESSVSKLITAVSAMKFDDVKALIDKHGQSLWKGVHYHGCVCGCARTSKPLELLFSVVNQGSVGHAVGGAYSSNKLEFIQKLIDSSVLKMETVSDEFIIDKFSDIFGQSANVSRLRLIIRNITKDRLVNMRGPENVNAIMAVMCSCASFEKIDELVDELLQCGVDYKVKRDDGYSPFFIAITHLNVKLVEKFKVGNNVNELINWQVYNDDGEPTSDYVNILHQLLPRRATTKRPDLLNALRQIIAILFNLGVNIKSVSSHTKVPAYSMIIAYEYIDLLPISRDQFWAWIGHDKKGVKYPLLDEYQYELDPDKDVYFGDRITARHPRLTDLYDYLYKVRFKKDPATINYTIAHIKHFYSQCKKEKLPLLEDDLRDATGNLYGYMEIPEIKALFG